MTTEHGIAALTEAHRVRHAPMKARAVAACVDASIVLGASLTLLQPFAPVVPLLILICYQTLTTWWLRASVGKALLGLRVVRVDGEVTLAWSVLRAGPGYLVLTVLGLGWVLAMVPPDRRPLHDRLLRGDVVVVEARARGLSGAGRRLASWAERREQVALRKQNRTAKALLAVFALLQWLGGGIQRLVDALLGSAAEGPSVVSTLSGTVTAWIVGGATAVVAVVLAPVPPLANAAEWMTTPRYWVGGAVVPGDACGLGATEGATLAPGVAPMADAGDPEQCHPEPMTGRWVQGDEAGPSSEAGERNPVTITRASDTTYVIGAELELSGEVCGSWQQTMTTAEGGGGGRSGRSFVTTLRGGALAGNLARCYDLLTEQVGPTDSALVTPLERLEYEASTDRITYWLVPSPSDDPEQVVPGPYYLWPSR